VTLSLQKLIRVDQDDYGKGVKVRTDLTNVKYVHIAMAWYSLLSPPFCQLILGQLRFPDPSAFHF